MKLLLPFSLLSALLISHASATTVIADGGTVGYQFGFTTTLDGLDFTTFTSSTASITVGMIEGGVFTAFAPGDTTPPTFGNAGLLAGRWLGGAGDNSSAADAFGNRQIWFAINTVIAGQSYTGYFADLGTLFPVNNGGAGDDTAVLSNDLDTVSSLSTGAWAIDAANGRVTLAVPEPSTALVGALGALALLRRRR